MVASQARGNIASSVKNKCFMKTGMRIADRLEVKQLFFSFGFELHDPGEQLIHYGSVKRVDNELSFLFCFNEACLT